jgi:L-fucose isomerase-like protein
MNKVTLIGLYSHAHPEDISRDRIKKTVNMLEHQGIEVNFLGSVKDHDDALVEKTRKKLEDTVSNSCCIILVYSGWSESTGILNIISSHLHLPMIIWSLAGYKIKPGLVAPAAAAGASLLRNTLDSMDIKYICIYESLGSRESIGDVIKYIDLFAALREFCSTKIASIGYACSDLYPFMYDGSLIKTNTGIHVDNLELLELKSLADEITQEESMDFKKEFQEKYYPEKKISHPEIDILSKYYVAAQKLIEKNAYRGITMMCGSGPGKFLGFTPCMLLSLIGEKINAICEGDVYGLLAQTIVNRLTGLKPTFLEVFEFYNNSVLMASCGFAPFSLCKKDCIEIYQHDWGGCGGLMNISKLKTGEITVFNFFVKNGKMEMQVFSGKGDTPEKFQEEGWHEYKGPMIPALDISIDAGIGIFKENIAGPHYLILHGDHRDVIAEYCRFSGIELKAFY